MRKLIILNSLLITLLVSSLFAGNLTISPGKVKTGGKISLQYSPDERFAGTTSIYAIFYCFNDSSSMPQGNEIELKKSNGNFSGSFIIPAGVNFMLIKILGTAGNTEITDNNFKKLWDVVIYGSIGKPLRNAYLNRGVSFLGNLPQNAGRIVDYSSALESLEKEMQEFPDNTEASIGLNSLKYDLKKIPKEDFEVKMKLAMRDFKSVESENGVQTISKVYRMMGKSEEAKALEQKYIDRQPYSHIAEEAVLAKLAGAGSLTEFSEIAEEYFNKFPDSQKRDKIFSALVTAYLQVSDYNGLQSALSRIQGVSPIVYSQLALDLLNNEKLLPRNSEKEKYEMASEIYYKKLRFYITDSTSTFNMKKPEFFSSIEWTADRRYYRGSLAEVASEIYAKKGTIDTAIQMGKLALKLQGDDASPNLYQKLIELLSTSDSTEAAYNTAVNAILASKTNEDIYSYHRSLYESLNPDFADSYTALIDSLENIAKVKRLALLKYEELNIPKANAYLQDPVGFMLDLNDIKGHVGVLYFWSSWCGVCGEVFPPLNYLYEKYQDSAFCKIVYVNVWENPKDNRDNTIKEYFKDTDYNFKVYYEETDALPQKYGITGLPVTVILDKKGMAQFIIKGFTNEGDYVRSVEDRIEFLSNQ